MENLPKEILLEIFSYLSAEDLLKACLVCKDFNDIVTTSSCLLMKIRLRLNPKKLLVNKKTDNTPMLRKYTNVILKKPSSSVLRITKDIAENLMEIKIMYGSIHLRSLTQILRKTTKLRKLSVVKVSFISEDDLKEPLPKLNLDHLHYSGNKVFFRTLMESSVKNLSIFSVSNTLMEVNYLKNFLKVQNKIESLEFASFNIEMELFDDETLTSVEFRLKKLLIYNFRNFEATNFFKFLSNHENSLTELKLKNDRRLESVKSFYEELMMIVLKFKNFKQLSLTRLPLFIPKTPVNNMIKKLSFENVKKLTLDGVMCANYPNIHSIEFDYIEKLNVDLRSLKHLKHVSIDSSVVSSFEIPSITSLSLSTLDLRTELFESHEIKELYIDNCTYFEVLLVSIQKGLQLNTLKIENCNIQHDLMEFVVNSKDKVKNFIMNNVIFFRRSKCGCGH